MGENPVVTAAVFLIQTLFGLYLLAVMLRLIFQWVHADFYNTVSQFLVKITNPPLKPLRRIVPGLFGIDFASIILLLALKMLEQFTIGLLKGYMFQLAVFRKKQT